MIFLIAYAILRSIPNKLGGVVALAYLLLFYYYVRFYIQVNLKDFLFTPLINYCFEFTLMFEFYWPVPKLARVRRHCACQKNILLLSLNIFCLIYIFIFVDILSAQRLYLGLSETFSLTFFSLDDSKNHNLLFGVCWAEKFTKVFLKLWEGVLLP